MHELKATYKIVTPMFIGGANQTTTDGIRPPSIKGALRFWWRALNWGRFWKESQEDEEKALQSLHQEEARLFGASMGSKENTGGQGCFLLSVTQPEKISINDNWPPNDPNNTASYMAYGLLKTNEEEHRFAIEESKNTANKKEISNIEFELKFVFKNKVKESDIQQINQALEAWSLFGGLGGRSRRAMGSITLANIDSNTVLYSKDEYSNKIEALLKSYKSVPDAPFTAFSKNSLFYLINTGKNARTLVEKMGREYKEFRGQEGLRGKKKVPFGLPLQDVDMENRRSSPLFFHVHALQNNNFAGINLFMPSKIFHPDKQYANTSMNIVEQFIRRGKS